MESCVLIPDELSLVLRAPLEDMSDKELSDNYNHQNDTGKDISSEHGGMEDSEGAPGKNSAATPDCLRAKPLEMSATVWTNTGLLPGKTFLAEQGRIRLETLEVYSTLNEDDVSF